MPKYIIEREISGAANLSKEQLHDISAASCKVLERLGPQVQWQHSYVAGDKIYCIYIAPNKESVLEHAKLGGFPANLISRVASIIDPITAE